ncbi:87415e4c-996c-477d-a65a-137e051d0dba [Sclerotinia trifoliorum]|uniref:87415e4c-996c-477d-a65a-137e051d0dba n=1 Tax=Sclerotinia trifoliorum TaxID=28548 RepID=A0A8H2W3P3_9HELO|nr:87415e4c-996c-477d-a65a-137e051d0dba [Sclerotinia trifoliorum]
MDTVNSQITTSTPPLITSTNLTSSTTTSEITSAPIAATDSNTQSASSPQPNLSNNKTPESFSLNLAIGIGIGIGIAIVLLIAGCVPIYKLWKRRQQAAQGQNQYNHQAPPQPYPYEMHYPMYYQQFQEMQIASNFHKETDVDKSSRKSMHRCTQVFEMSDKRQTDSWVKEMMLANQEELWMESPIR